MKTFRSLKSGIYLCISKENSARLDPTNSIIFSLVHSLPNDRQRYIESKYRKFPSAFNLNSLFNVSGPRL